MNNVQEVNFANDNIMFSLHEEGEYISDFIRKEENFYELDHLEILNYLPIKNEGAFIDIGANIGNHTIYYAKIMNRDVYAFEPIKENCQLLKNNILLNKIGNKVKSFNFALGNVETDVYISKNYKDNSGTWSVKSSNGDIPCKRLDTVLDDTLTIAYMKLDVEGQELNVLKGAKKTIVKNKPIISTEYHFGIEFSKIENFLKKLGYKVAFIAGRSSNAIFIHSSVMDAGSLANLQNFIEQLKMKNLLMPKTLSYDSSFLEEKQSLSKIETIQQPQVLKQQISFNEDDILAKAFFEDEKLSTSRKIDIIEPNVIADIIIDKIGKAKKDIVVNFTEKSIDTIDSINFSHEDTVLFNNQEIISGHISQKTQLDVIRHLISTVKSFNFISLVDFDEKHLSMAHELYELNGVEYGIFVTEVPHLHWEKWTYLSNAKFIRTDDEELLKLFQTKFIFHIDLDKKNLVTKDEFSIFDAKIEISHKAKKRGLLISYYYEPAMSVGVFRPSYWFNKIQNLSKETVHLELVTAMHQIPNQENIHFVPDYGCVTSIFTDTAIKQEHEKIKNSVNTVAFSWTKSLEKYFDNHPELSYDFVILTGNPFMHFYFSDYAQEKWGATIIQDYRDPMGKNPRFYSKDSNITDKNEKMRQSYEDQFCAKADVVITVNEYCAKDMSIMSPQPVEIIRNGYDDRAVDNIDQLDLKLAKEQFPYKELQAVSTFNPLNYFNRKNRSPNNRVIRLCYAGSFAHDRKPENLIKSVKNTLGYELHHFGTPYPIMQKSTNSRLVSHGKASYNKVISSMLCMDIGVVYCSHDFESTTKIYDYIACNMVILVITSEANLRPFTLSRELEGLEHVYWVANREDLIDDFLQHTVFLTNINRPQREKFSRKEGTKKLINLIERD